MQLMTKCRIVDTPIYFLLNLNDQLTSPSFWGIFIYFCILPQAEINLLCSRQKKRLQKNIGREYDRGYDCDQKMV